VTQLNIPRGGSYSTVIHSLEMLEAIAGSDSRDYKEFVNTHNKGILLLFRKELKRELL
jgi:hypothetical protein